MHQRGKFVVALMFLLALCLSGYAWWYRFHENPRTKAFWGARAILTIERAPNVQFFTLSPAELAADQHSLSIDGQSYAATFRDIQQVPGFIHARHALVDDNSFAWTAGDDQDQIEWNFGLRFRDRSEQITLVFDRNGEKVLWLEEGKTIRLVPDSARAFLKKRNDWDGSEKEI